MTERGPTLKGAPPDIGGAGPLGQRTEGGSYPYNDTMEAQKGQSFLWVGGVAGRYGMRDLKKSVAFLPISLKGSFFKRLSILKLVGMDESLCW